MKIKYSIEALTPLFTGSDENNGTLRTLRREKRLLKNPIVIKSSFTDEVERTKALMNIIYPVYINIDQKLKRDNYGFYEAYANKVKAALSMPDKNTFLNKLLESCGIVVLSDGSAQVVRKALDQFSDIELLETMREEHQYLMILLREYVSFYRSNEGKQVDAQMDLFSPKKEDQKIKIEKIEFRKSFVSVPYIGGNSIRGYLRRLIMYDFCKSSGIEKLNKNVYHQLFTGGNINDSTGFEDIEKRETFIKMCPPIGLLGSAIGNMTIEGELKVIGARLHCKENNSGDMTFWQFIEQNFGTRLDSSKKEKKIEIIDNTEEKSQMIYQYENFVTGSIFDSSFVLTTENELLISTFWHMIRLWKENPFVGGNSARDSGMIDIRLDIPDQADDVYLEYIESNKDKIKEYFYA